MMSIKTLEIGYEPRAKKMAKQIEAASNEMEQMGYAFLTFSITESGKAILAFRGDEAAAAPAQETEENGMGESKTAEADES